ncbi:hypothetical protein GH714_037149 [Hevea brasiliensis]|uniref:Strictosidine synthase conserved region domain-containing protein n=1 Tax=Hevea brasiliensis TaxID=3981 RepID=A0A6A6M8G0_HEVBR|nr:hypothetical protein GH714_037149 [Hevea brasiliensis]
MNRNLTLAVAAATLVALLSILIADPINLFVPPSLPSSHDHLHSAKVVPVAGAVGPESLVFDPNGEGPYTVLLMEEFSSGKEMAAAGLILPLLLLIVVVKCLSCTAKRLWIHFDVSFPPLESETFQLSYDPLSSICVFGNDGDFIHYAYDVKAMACESWLLNDLIFPNNTEVVSIETFHFLKLRKECTRPFAPELEHVCGRPLGLRFDKKTGNLYIADAYLGLQVVGPNGGLAKPVVSEVEGHPLRFTNDLDIDEEGDVIYFTDTSKIFQRSNNRTHNICIIAINRTKFSDKPSYIQSFSGDNIDKLNQQRELLHLGSSATGPESFAFGKHGQGPYASIADGRIIKWEEHRRQWIDFAVTSLHRAGCERSYDHYQVEPICGRPLGGLATTIATLADGIPFRFTNGLDIDQSSGTVYFTDSSSVYQRRDYIYVILSGDKSGRLMRYDPEDRQVKVLVENLSFPNGVALSKDGNFILLAETTTCRILRYWIKTCKIGTLEVFAQLPGFPDNIKRSPRGGYWVGLHSKREKLLEWILSHTWIGNALIRLPFDLMKAYSILGEYRGSGMAIRLSENGDILEVFEDKNGFKSISEGMEKDGKLWIGSINLPFAGRYNL